MERAHYEASLLDTIQQLEQGNTELMQRIDHTRQALEESRQVEKALLTRMNAQSEVITMLEETSGQPARRLPQIRQQNKASWIRSRNIATTRRLQRPAI